MAVHVLGATYFRCFGQKKKIEHVTEENVNYLGHKSEPPAGGTGNDTIDDPKV